MFMLYIDGIYKERAEAPCASQLATCQKLRNNADAIQPQHYVPEARSLQNEACHRRPEAGGEEAAL